MGPGGAPAVVIGGGAAGVAAALELAGAGRRVVLLEAGTALGGRARSFWEPGSGQELDWGPHLFMAANSAWRDLLGRIGAAADLKFDASLTLTYRQAAPDGVCLTRLAFPARGGSVARLAALLRWRGPGLRSRLEIGLGLFRLLAAPGNKDESVETMLARLGQGAEARKWFWEPFSRAVLNLPAEKGSAALLRSVLVEAFGGGGAGAALGSPSVSLGALWARRAAETIRALGGE
ncbi:MAG: FAD-dependent oxidoreductase, partial [bacterium]|nr:FAD-dependent oxidoreductase [bacterium]